MTEHNFVLIREDSKALKNKESFTPGKLYYNGLFLCYTCEDLDRKLEDGGLKVKTRTAIPRGIYNVVISLSNRFKKLLPELLRVPQFVGIRIHSGNTAEDSEGCILVGMNKTTTGVSNCAPALKLVMDRIKEGSTIEIK